MRFVYLIPGIFFIVLFFLNLYHFRRNNIGFFHFIIWTLSIIALSFFSFFPSSIDFIQEFLGLKLRANFLILILAIVVFSFIFSQWHTNDKIKKKIVQLNQKLSIHNFYVDDRDDK